MTALTLPDLEHFAAFCKTLTLDTGERMRLEDFQEELLTDYFDGARETLVLIPKKNGKTTLMAALVVHHLAYVDEARCYVAASSKEQASILYDHARGFVNRSPALQRRIIVRAGTRELRARRDGGVVKVLAADSDTADGVGPTLAIVDELHRAKSTALYDVFRDGLDARGGSMLTITTAGEDEESPLGKMRTAALEQPHVKRRGRYTYARSRDRSFVMHEYALRPTDNLEDIDLVKTVNPLRSQTKAKLRRRRNSPSMTTHAWARFACNVWAQDESAAIATLDWARIALERGIRLPAGDGAGEEGPRVVIGIDLGWTQDSSALIPVGHKPGEPDLALVDERLKIIPSPGDRTMIDEELIKEPLREWGHHETGIWPRCEFAIDPNAGGQSLAQWIERELCAGDSRRVRIVSQQPAPMQLASMHLSDGIRAKRVEEPGEDADEDEPRTVPLRHPAHPDLNRHVRASVARYNGDRWRFDKRRVASGSTRANPRPIDGVIALTLAYWVLTAPAEEELVPFVISAR